MTTVDDNESTLTARTPLDLRALRIKRVIAHVIFQKDSKGQPVQPQLSTKVLDLPNDALLELEDRIAKALGENAASLPIEFFEQAAGSYYAHGNTVLSARTDDEFVEASQEIAQLLADAQLSRNPPGGVLLIVQASLKLGTMPLALVIKAEAQSGFGRKSDSGEVEIEVIKELFLTRRQAVYKVAALARPRQQSEAEAPEVIGWLFDSNLTRRDAQVRPANYFLQGFLKAKVRETGATETAAFYRAVTTFANEADISDQERLQVIDNLATFLAREEITVFTVQEFQETNIPEDIRDQFHEHIVKSEIPLNGIQLDTTHIKNQVRKNALEFTSMVRINYPAGEDLITVVGRSDDGKGTLVRISGELLKAR